ncbi:hypothetical protein F4860DRAFT_496161 [Xylaria cubensis]|nr:hypothetical protein F4860DRAFT_496161 [Xylaria cubensis]
MIIRVCASTDSQPAKQVVQFTAVHFMRCYCIAFAFFSLTQASLHSMFLLLVVELLGNFLCFWFLLSKSGHDVPFVQGYWLKTMSWSFRQ